jgi:quinol monooxygenase YgiN
VVQATVKMVMPADRIDEAVQILHSIAERTRVEAGCFDCCVHRDTGDECVLVFEQTWNTEDAMLRHLASEEYRNVLLVMDMCSEQPMVRFDTITGSTGLETVEAARSIKKDGE